MAQVVLQNVAKVYPGDVVAASNVNLEILDGEFVVLVGPSGCGKSTILRMIAGLESITEGMISIGGRIVNGVEPKDRDIAMVFQSYALYPHMSVYDNMAFGLKLRGTPQAEIKRKVAAAAEVLGIEEYLERKPKALSGGQRQRVALGRAIVRDPAVFLFDEPLSNLDAKMRVQMRTEISRLHHHLGATMIYVTHDQVEAMTMGQRIVVVHEGRIQQVDTPLNLYEKPVNRFVAGFIGSPAMNFFEGQLAGDGEVHLEFGDGGSLVLPGYVPDAALLERPIVLGVRPEHIEITAQEADGATRLPLQVVEPLGNETLLYFETGGTPLVVRAPGNLVPPIESEIPLAPLAEHLLLFDPADGTRLG